MPSTKRSSQRVAQAAKKRKTVANAIVSAAVAMTTASLPETASALAMTPKKNAPRKSPRKVSPSPNKKKVVQRTSSFEPLWAGTVGNLVEDSSIPVHTLILGTHPSIKSLTESQYYGHPMNAFWWIAGDCLGFRRGSGISPATGEPYKFTDQLRYDQDRVISYEEQVNVMVSHGFAIWDVVKSCERKGSLDSAIQKEVPNDIRGFCQSHPSVKRIVLANGTVGSKLFVKHFRGWWQSGELQPASNKESQRDFSTKALSKVNFENAKITCVSAISVSPAAAKFSYQEKRDFWETHVYKPGLQDFEEQQQQSLQN